MSPFLLSQPRPRGEVITFYSYKGGTGRTMALANTAVLLANRAQARVLVIDWDLEAPGLHHYFVVPSQDTQDAPATPYIAGVVELLDEYCQHLVEGNHEPSVFFEDGRLNRYTRDTSIENVKIMCAGRFDTYYAERVASLNFDALFQAAPAAYRVLADELARQYDYVLIDSRTGLNDASGTCTALLPSKLVAVFTPNRQSVDGVVQAVRNAVSYREQSDDERPLMVYPLASRVEVTEERLVKRWRYGEQNLNIKGYQKQFEMLFMSLYALEKCDLSVYFNEIEIQHVPRYAFGEDIAVVNEDADVRLSLARSYRNFADHLVKISAPWNSPTPESLIADTFTYDAYVFGSWQVKDTISRLAKGLKRNRLKVFDTVEDIKLGQDIQKTMRVAMCQSRTFIIVVGEIFGEWAEQEIKVILEEAEKRRARVIPVVLPEGRDLFRSHSQLYRYFGIFPTEALSEGDIQLLVAASR